MKDGGVNREINRVQDGQQYNVGQNFSFESMAVTHSVPDTKHFAITTPAGVIYHGTDFKIDDSPVDGVKTNLKRIEEVGQNGVLCALLDCLRVEKQERIPSESTTGPAIDKEIASTVGKSVITSMSSHIHRIQQIIDSAVKHGRKIVFVGRSVEQNVQVALETKKMNIPAGALIEKEDIEKYQDNELCIVIAGSQGQEGSSLVRAVSGEHREVTLNPKDKVIFAADAIPGNEVPYYRAIDELCHQGVDVVYPELIPNLHQSGHASSVEQQQILKLVNPKYAMPIGGGDRHRVKFVTMVAQKVGIDKNHVLLPDTGQIVSFQDSRVSMTQKVKVNPQSVDGLGVGDVGPRVIADRKALSESGMIVIVIPKKGKQLRLREMKVISRGFVFMKEAEEVVAYIKERTAEIVSSLGKNPKESEIRVAVEKRLGRSVNKIIRRQPMIVTVVVNV